MSEVPCSWPVASCSRLSVRMIFARLPDVPVLSLPMGEASGFSSDEEPRFRRVGAADELRPAAIELFDEEARLSMGAGAGGAGVELGGLRGLSMDRMRCAFLRRGRSSPKS